MRHFLIAIAGETDIDRQGRLHAAQDCSLNSSGLAQARRLASGLANNVEVNPALLRIITSPAKWAVETAEIVADVLKIPAERVVQDPRVRECSFGRLEGQQVEDVKQRHGKGFLALNPHFPYSFASVGGESQDLVMRRMVEVYADCRRDPSPDAQVLLVSHPRALWTLRRHCGETGGMEHGFCRPLPV